MHTFRPILTRSNCGVHQLETTVLAVPNVRSMIAGLRPLNIGVRYWGFKKSLKIAIGAPPGRVKGFSVPSPYSPQCCIKVSAAVHPLGQLFARALGRAIFEAADPNYRALAHPIASVG
jgi:hypothetical protein